MKKLIALFKFKFLPFLLSVSSFSGILLFRIIGKKIDIPNIKWVSIESLKYGIYLKYFVFILIVLGLARISIFLARKYLFDGIGETMSVKEIKPVEGSYLPVYIGLFVIALSFSESNWTPETSMLLFLIFLFWLKLESVSYFNPFLLIFGYRFYEVKSGMSTTFTLITKRKDLKNISSINNLIHLNNFTYLEKSNGTV